MLLAILASSGFGISGFAIVIVHKLKTWQSHDYNHVIEAMA